MLRRFRQSTAVHVALGLAALLTVGASFGLHPEPGSARFSIASDGISVASVAGPTHSCLACLSHGAALVSPAALFAAAAGHDAPRFRPGDSNPLSRLEVRRLAGRSPPSAS